MACSHLILAEGFSLNDLIQFHLAARFSRAQCLTTSPTRTRLESGRLAAPSPICAIRRDWIDWRKASRRSGGQPKVRHSAARCIRTRSVCGLFCVSWNTTGTALVVYADSTWDYLMYDPHKEAAAGNIRIEGYRLPGWQVGRRPPLRLHDLRHTLPGGSARVSLFVVGLEGFDLNQCACE